MTRAESTTLARAETIAPSAPERPARTRAAEIAAAPWAFDFFATLRLLERSFPHRPKIGDSLSPAEDYVLLGQDPYITFPASNLARFTVDEKKRFHVYAKFLGFLGPHGALPLTTTEEALAWIRGRDDAFARFLDIFNNRFLQLFFRAWADSRPIAHRDRPRQDRFLAYAGAPIGIGSPVFRGRDSVSDLVKLRYAGLLASAAKSASRLRGLLAGVFGVRVEVEEFVGMWLPVDPSEQMRLGEAFMSLGADTLVGAKVFSVQDKIRIRIHVRDLAEYRTFLPGGRWATPLADLVFFYLGHEVDYDIELAIPANKVEPMRLGSAGQLGWTGWVAPDTAAPDEVVRTDARFHPESRRAAAA